MEPKFIRIIFLSNTTLGLPLMKQEKILKIKEITSVKNIFGKQGKRAASLVVNFDVAREKCKK